MPSITDPIAHLYHPLPGVDTFRLLVLEPSPRSCDPVSVRLLVTEPSTAPEYDAISYVWGDTEKKIDIKCDGLPFAITANLHWALVRIRDVLIRRVVWADAICINQLDLQERSYQVTFMGSLYSRARNVYLCMGDDIDDNAAKIKSVVSDTILWLRDERSRTISGYNALQKDLRWYSLAPLTHNPWFERTWVVQEAALAQNPQILYGTEEIPYRDLIHVRYWLNTSAWAVRYGLSSLYIHLEWADWRSPPRHSEYTFLDLLSHASLLTCSDPRDKIYAFLGHPLARTPSGDLIVKPDYEKHPKEIYLELSKKLIQYFGLRALTMVEHTPETITESQPSWVTQWDISLIMNDIYKVPNDSFFVSAGFVPSAPTINWDNHLILRGVKIDRVIRSLRIIVDEDIGVTFENFQSGERTSFKEALESIRTDASISPYVDRQEAFCQTLCAGMSELYKKLWRPAVNLGKHLESEKNNRNEIPEPSNDAMVYYSEVRAYCTNRSFVVTEQGLYCLAPLLTQSGDISCVLIGADVPFILRPIPGHQQLRLLGESYIHGVMSGQIHGMVQRGELYEETFVIR